MTKDCYFSCSPELDQLLSGSFDTTPEPDEKYLVSNKPENAEIFAPEINFYFQNSQDSLQIQAENIKKLYDARLDELDYSRETVKIQQVRKTILLVAPEPDTEVIEPLKQVGFAVHHIYPDDMLNVTGEIGTFSLLDQNGEQLSELIFDQIIWNKRPISFKSYLGTYSLAESSKEAIIEKIIATPTEITIPHRLHFQKAMCLWSNSRENLCTECVIACNHTALNLQSTKKNIEIIHSACSGCGQCVSVCPTGALEATWMPRNSLPQRCSHFQGNTLLILANDTDLRQLTMPLPAGVLPIMLRSTNVLDENHLLTIIQATGKPLIVYTEPGNDLLIHAADFINDIQTRKSRSKLVHVCHSPEQIQESFKVIEPTYADLLFSPASSASKRVDTAQRLSHMIAEQDLGQINTNGQPPFGSMTINTESCTLCLACADACKVKALTIHPEDNSLRFTASHCVQCGYCMLTCPEQNCLTLLPNAFPLAASSFQPQVMAFDELFSCIECGKEFAPKKVVEKIIRDMSAHFAGDPLKLRTLSCCPECKSRVMVEQQIYNQQMQEI